MNFKAKILITLTALCLLASAFGFAGAQDFSLKLTGGYSLNRLSSYTVFVSPEVWNEGTPTIPNKVVQIAWDKRFILAKRQGFKKEKKLSTRFSRTDLDPKKFDYWILDTQKPAKVFGPLTEAIFRRQCAEWQISPKLKDVDKYRPKQPWRVLTGGDKNIEKAILKKMQEDGDFKKKIEASYFLPHPHLSEEKAQTKVNKYTADLEVRMKKYANDEKRADKTIEQVRAIIKKSEGLSQKKKHADAEKMLKTEITKNPAHKDILNIALAQVYFSQGKTTVGEEVLKKIPYTQSNGSIPSYEELYLEGIKAINNHQNMLGAVFLEKYLSIRTRNTHDLRSIGIFKLKKILAYLKYAYGELGEKKTYDKIIKLLEKASDKEHE